MFFAVALAGCSSFSDTVNVYIGDNNQLLSVVGSSESKEAADKNDQDSIENSEGAVAASARQGNTKRGFRCEFETYGEKPSIFSTKSKMGGSFECVRTGE